MDSSLLVILGGFMILVGFLSMLRFRFVAVRRRLTPAASIRSGLGTGYATGTGSSMGRTVSMLLMIGGGLVIVAGMLAA